MFCPNCGDRNEQNSKFCTNCGYSLKNSQTGQQHNEEPTQSYNDQKYPYYEEPSATHFERDSQIYQQRVDGASSQPYRNESQLGNGQFQPTNSQRYNQQPEKKNMKVWVISGVALVLLAVLSYGIFTYFNMQNTAKPMDDTKVEQVGKDNNPEKQEIITDDEDVEDKKDEKESIEDIEKVVVEEKEKTQIIKESLPKVFTIITQDGHGSGFLYAEGGYIVTNAHVVAGYSDVLVRNSAGQESPGKVIGISDTLDIALIQSDDYAKTDPLPIEFSLSDIGIEVIAIGSPQGFENSASIGYLTGTNREMSIDGYNFVYDELYQIDAQIDQGSSGGPLFDATTGKVIGINSIVYLNYQSFAFAIPVYTVKEYFDGWINNPMSATDVVAVDVYAGYDTNTSDLDEDYSEFWDWYNTYYGEGTDEELDYDNYLNTYGFYFDESTLTNFINSYFEYYEWSINDGDFYWVQDMISTDSNAYLEIERQIEEYYGSNYAFEYLSTEITGIDIFEDEGYAIVTTLEEYNLYNASGDYTTYKETAEYYVVIDENGYYLISDMYYYEAP